ncbi:MAG TPA: DUF1643 domain-containing protein [Nocardioidaceae bacterium]|nr:DUF1643 domain-containing protein [Nocardioidaceae bacterium]
MSEQALFPIRDAGGVDLRHPDAGRLGYDPADTLRTAWLSDESPEPLYRWTLHRRTGSGEVLTFIMLNPSTADALADDPTITKCLGFAARLGFSGIQVVNLYPWRATKPADLWSARRAGADITGGRKGNGILEDALRDAARDDRLMLAAWGANAAKDPARVKWLCSLPGAGRLHALSITRDGHPGHPLMLPYSCIPIRWEPR